MNTQPEKPFIKNKAAQVFALTFVMEYLTLWPKFFFDVLSLVGLSPQGLDIYLRTLMAIDAEVVDRDIVHSPEVWLTLSTLLFSFFWGGGNTRVALVKLLLNLLMCIDP